VGERGPGQPAARGAGQEPGGPELAQHAGVVGRVHHHADVGVVLGRRPHHGGPAHVDHLDRGLRAERVEVADDEVDGVDALSFQVGQVLGLGTVGEDAAVDPGVQGLHPPAQHLGSAGDGLHLQVGDARLGECAGRAPARDQLVAEGHEAPGEGVQAGLVVHREEGPHQPMNSLICISMTLLVQ
jgi:hypothetical protein